MYLINLGFTWSIPYPENAGVIIGAQGVNAYQSLNRPGRRNLPDEGNRFFDPQLYLKGLNYQDSQTIVSRLATYPWMNPNVSDMEPGENQTDWQERIYASVEAEWPQQISNDNIALAEDVISRCIEHQINFGVKGIILPSPLTIDPESDYSLEMNWVDLGLNSIPEGNELPIFATLAFSDTIFNERDPNEIELLKIIVDQLSVRTDLNGIYIVVEQRAPNSPYLMEMRVAWGLLSLCHDLGVRSGFEVIVNYAGVFGMACLAAGAESFGIGCSSKGNRLSLNDYINRGGGGAFPRFYSQSLIMDFYPQRDIENKIASLRLLRLVSSNKTAQSEILFSALENGTRVSDTPDWVENINNTHTSKAHFLNRIDMAVSEFHDQDDKKEYILTWLQDAERSSTYLNQRFKDNPLSSEIRHITSWREAFEKFLAQYNL